MLTIGTSTFLPFVHVSCLDLRASLLLLPRTFEHGLDSAMEWRRNHSRYLGDPAGKQQFAKNISGNDGLAERPMDLLFRTRC